MAWLTRAKFTDIESSIFKRFKNILLFLNFNNVGFVPNHLHIFWDHSNLDDVTIPVRLNSM